MKSNNKYLKYVVFLFCSVLLLVLGSCETSRTQTHSATQYQRVRTRHQPHWNATTSQSTTYYIKKHSTRKSHDSEKRKR